MPITRSAIKKLRKDKRKTEENRSFEKKLAQTMRKFQKKKSMELLSQSTSFIDKATKKHFMHPNKASRLKSKLSKMVPPKDMKETKTPSKPKTTEKVGRKKALKKSTAKK